MPDTVLIAEEMDMNKIVLILTELMIWWRKMVGKLVISGDKCYSRDNHSLIFSLNKYLLNTSIHRGYKNEESSFLPDKLKCRVLRRSNGGMDKDNGNIWRKA